MTDAKIEIINRFKEGVTSVVNISTDGGYTAEQVLNNKNCSKDPKYWHNISNTERYLFKSNIAESWEFFYPKIENPISNTNQIYLRFKKSYLFQTESNYFKEHSNYSEYLEDTKEYDNYWDTVENRCLNSYIIDGVRITGRHYFAINFGRIMAVPVDKFGNATNTRKVETFLRFLDHQYYLLNELEECFLEGVYSKLDLFLSWFPLKTENDFIIQQRKNFLAVKARRKGFSYIVDNSLYAYTFSFIPYSNLKLFSYLKGAYKTTLDGIHMTLNFLNDVTEFGKRRDVLDKRENFRASFKMISEGREIEKGFKSEFQAISFKDNPFNAIGNSADIVGVEEAGIFDNLLEVYFLSIEPLIRDGENYIGNAVIWGSTGDMEGGGSISLRDMMYRPSAYNIKSYNNIYEDKLHNEEVGWFIDDLWYSPKTILKSKFLKYVDNNEIKNFIIDNYPDVIHTVDNNGNSHRFLSKYILLHKRQLAKKGSLRAYQKLITQQPLYLSEAFLVNESSPFDTMMAQEAISILKTIDGRYYETGSFSINKNNEVNWILDVNAVPLLEYPTKVDDPSGCWIIYEFPKNLNSLKDVANWRYIAGLDPIDFGYEEVSSSGLHSLASCFIIDSLTRNIVAEYTGRPRIAETYYEQLRRGLLFYNATLLYENNLKGLFSYFKRKDSIYLLANEPNSLKDRWGYRTNNRVKGFHATKQINSYARELIHKWSTEDVKIDVDANENYKTISRMFLIKSLALLQEMVAWNSKGNFDRISGLGAAMLLLFDKEVVEPNNDKKVDKFLHDGVFNRVRKLKKFENNGTLRLESKF